MKPVDVVKRALNVLMVSLLLSFADLALVCDCVSGSARDEEPCDKCHVLAFPSCRPGNRSRNNRENKVRERIKLGVDRNHCTMRKRQALAQLAKVIVDRVAVFAGLE